MSAAEEEYPEDFGDDSTPAASSTAPSLRDHEHHVASPQQPQPHDIDDPELVSSLVQFAASGEEDGVRVAGACQCPRTCTPCARVCVHALASCSRPRHIARSVRRRFRRQRGARCLPPRPLAGGQVAVRPALPWLYFCDILRMYAAGASMDATNVKTKENTASLAVKSGNSALLQAMHRPPPLPPPSLPSLAVSFGPRSCKCFP